MLLPVPGIEATLLHTLAAFLVAIAVLVAVHEWGHFAVARLCGVKVLCFSIGFGPRLLGWTSAVSGTEYRIGLLPLGGFVRMLDEREGPVAPHELQAAFNRMPVGRRALIVAAGPVANLLLAVMLYSTVNWVGVQEPVARLARPAEGTIARNAGLKGGEWIQSVAIGGDLPSTVRSFEDLRWTVIQAALHGEDATLSYRGEADAAAPLRQVVLPLSGFDTRQLDVASFSKLGLDAPFSAARIGELRAGGAAQAAGLQSGDIVQQVDGIPVADAAWLRDWIRSSGADQMPVTQLWQVQRQGQSIQLRVTPHREPDGGVMVGRVGAMIGAMPEMLTVRFGLLEGVQRALAKTWQVSRMTASMMLQVATGVSSYRNLSGPITIADYAGRSAAIGATQFMAFLALISISLGVLNLLPVPVLDGGHLMYYLWESVTGHSVAEVWMARLQRVGIALLLLMMSVAIFNDLSRLLS